MSSKRGRHDGGHTDEYEECRWCGKSNHPEDECHRGGPWSSDAFWGTRAGRDAVKRLEEEGLAWWEPGWVDDRRAPARGSSSASSSAGPGPRAPQQPAQEQPQPRVGLLCQECGAKQGDRDDRGRTTTVEECRVCKLYVCDPCRHPRQHACLLEFLCKRHRQTVEDWREICNLRDK